MPQNSLPHAYGRQLTDAEIQEGVHRTMVGDMWEELGKLQFDFLCAQGLLPEHQFLDVGCGALRGGIHFIRYLEPGHYCGIDLNASLIKAGRDVELPAVGLVDKHPHLLVNDRFVFEKFGRPFDFVLALSVFTHLPVNSIERCLVKLVKVLKPGGRFFASFFEAPQRHHLEEIVHPGGIVTRSDADPFHYHVSTFVDLARDLPLRVKNLGAWNHPRSQHMLMFVRNDQPLLRRFRTFFT